MPAKRRISLNLDDESNLYLHQQPRRKRPRRNHEDRDFDFGKVEEEEEEKHGGDDDEDSHHHHHHHHHHQTTSSSSSGGEKEDYLVVKLSDVRKDVQCPICLGIIRKTRTVMECLHRFCRECIDKSMRLGNNECPACRTHCASRRSLRDDPNYDTIIATLYPDIDKYEEKELAFGDEEKNRNKQIQASIAQTYQRQSEALGKKQPRVRAMRKRRGRKRKNQATRFEESDDDFSEDEESSSDEDIEPKRCKSSKAPHTSEPSSASVNADIGSHENNTIDVSRESRGVSPGSIGKPEVPVWGKGGTRSHTRVTRHGSVSSGNGRSTRSNRLVHLVNYVVGLDENDDEV